MELIEIAQRIKGSRLIKLERSGQERLYIRYGKNNSQYKTTAYLQVINDRITPVVSVKNSRHPDLLDREKADKYEEEIFKQFYELIHDCELKRRMVPLHERLKDDIDPVYSEDSLLHQVQALRFLCTMKVGALYADTGAGKTKIAIDLAISRYEAGQIKKVLVFCPVSTKNNFRVEIDKWDRQQTIEWKIVGLETMGSSKKSYLQAYEWVDHETMIIVDECHYCKTPFAKRSIRVADCCLKTSYKLIMSGTMMEHVRDAFMQYGLLSELIIGCKNWFRFEQKYLIMGGPSGDEVIGYKNLDHLLGLIEPYTYQIRKEECLQLPAKRISTYSCDLNSCQTDYYIQIKAELLREIEKENVTATTIFRYLTLLQQIACGFYRDPDTKLLTDLGTSKYSLLDQTGYKDGQTLFFCKYLFEVDNLVKFLGRENCAIFTGQNLKERDQEKNLFTRGAKQFLVATHGTGGTGQNGMQVCNRLIFWSHTFKWTDRKQCIGRIDRQGQTREMEIIDLLTKSGIDYRIKNNLARKGNLADEIRQLLTDKTELKKYVNSL